MSTYSTTTTRNIKTRENVAKALSCCARGDCPHCPYDNMKSPDCCVASKRDAIYYLNKDSDDEKATVAVMSEEERRLRQVVKSQQQTINALLGI